MAFLSLEPLVRTQGKLTAVKAVAALPGHKCRSDPDER